MMPGSLAPEQELLVQLSFHKLVATGDAAASLFYRRLFETAPALRDLFPADMREQERKFTRMLQAAVDGLGQPEALLPSLRELGVRHVGYGVRAGDYDAVEAALLWTLEQCLGATFTPEVREAWQTAYRFLASAMQGG